MKRLFESVNELFAPGSSSFFEWKSKRSLSGRQMGQPVPPGLFPASLRLKPSHRPSVLDPGSQSLEPRLSSMEYCIDPPPSPLLPPLLARGTEQGVAALPGSSRCEPSSTAVHGFALRGSRKGISTRRPVPRSRGRRKGRPIPPVQGNDESRPPTTVNEEAVGAVRYIGPKQK